MSAHTVLFDTLSQLVGTTGQMLPIPGREADMMSNYAGGYTFEVSLRDRILRTVILGTDRNTYYADAKELTTDALNFVRQQIDLGRGKEILDVVMEVYREARAPKLQYGILLHAMLCRATDLDLRREALNAVKQYRTMGHLYMWKGAHKKAGKSKGFGRLVKKVLGEKIKAIPPSQLAYQITKYQQRKVGDEAWSFADLLSCAHVKTGTGENRACKVKDAEKAQRGAESATELDIVLRYAIDGWEGALRLAQASHREDCQVVKYLRAVHEVKSMGDGQIPEICGLIRLHRLTREQLPTSVLKDVRVLRTMLTDENCTRVTMPMTALIRNLGTMTSHGVFSGEDGKPYRNAVVGCLTNQTILQRAHLHPVQLLIAYFTYQKGHGEKGSTTWIPEPDLLRALDQAFYLAFKTIRPTGKRVLHALDCSGSMASAIPSCPHITSAQAVAVMAMTFVRAELNAGAGAGADAGAGAGAQAQGKHDFVLFTSSGGGFGRRNAGLYPVQITADMSLDQVSAVVQRSDYGTTDCGLPIVAALTKRSEYDAFIVYTDNETYAGNVHPSQAIKQYRKAMRIPAKMVVMATLASPFTIADPEDSGMMDVSGFDMVGPQMVADFIRGADAGPGADPEVDLGD